MSDCLIRGRSPTDNPCLHFTLSFDKIHGVPTPWMKLYYSTSQFPELAGLKFSEKRPILRAASKLLKKEDPWFTPSVVWLYSVCCGAVSGFALTILIALKPWVGTTNAVIIGMATMFPLAIISAFAVGHLGLSRIHPYVRRAISDRESQPPKERP
jgi:hypothetical protein